LGPVINYINPTGGGAGTIITISGSNFNGVTSVIFGDITVVSFTADTTFSWSQNITVTVPVGFTTGDIKVVSSKGMAVYPGFNTPKIYSFSPTKATTDSVVVIYGTNLNNVTDVYFGNVKAKSFTPLYSSSISAVIDSGATGNVKVVTGSDTIELGGFTFVNPVKISSFSPTAAATGTSVTIKGKNFNGAITVKFGNQPASSFTVISDSVINAVVGSGSSGIVTVNTPLSGGTLAGFIYLPPPTISYFYPLYGRSNRVLFL
jgi:hypothetical protein